MDKLKRPTFKVPEVIEPSEVVQKSSTLVSWLPLIFAGAAAGISIVALTEIKKLRTEVIENKNETNSELNELLSRRMESMELQLNKLTSFIKNRNEIEQNSKTIKKSVETPEPGVVKNVFVNPVVPKENGIQIINGEEYEEIEVTDDEEEEEI
jgi:hypothetical protein